MYKNGERRATNNSSLVTELNKTTEAFRVVEKMKVMEKFGVPEPQWILDRMDSGSLYWRRDLAGNNFRVKFRCDVEIKEFSRGEHELEEVEWPETLPTSSNLTMGMTAIVCIMVTVFLPWYIIGIN